MTHNNGLKFLIVASLVVFVSGFFIDDNGVQDIPYLTTAERKCAKKYDLIEDFGRRPKSRNPDLKDLRKYCFRKCLLEYNGILRPDHTIDVEPTINLLIKAKVAKVRNAKAIVLLERFRGCTEGVKVITCEDLKKVEECILLPRPLA